MRNKENQTNNFDSEPRDSLNYDHKKNMLKNISDKQPFTTMLNRVGAFNKVFIFFF